MNILTKYEIQKELNQLTFWELRAVYLHRNGKKQKSHRKYSFKKFSQAIEFIIKVAELAELFEHHPMIINDYKALEIKITTHDAGGITKKDFDLVKAIDQIEL